jgi:hypothetical protein
MNNGLLVLLSAGLAAGVLLLLVVTSRPYEIQDEFTNDFVYIPFRGHHQVSTEELHELQGVYGPDELRCEDVVMYAVQKLKYHKSLGDVVEYVGDKHANGSNWPVSRNCLLCNIGVITVQNLLKVGKARDFIAKAIASLCRKFHVEKGEVCDGLVNLFKVGVKLFTQVAVFIFVIVIN